MLQRDKKSPVLIRLTLIPFLPVQNHLQTDWPSSENVQGDVETIFH